MIRRICVAVDGSESARRAYEVALDLARALSTSLRIVTVVPFTPVNLGALGAPWGAPPASTGPDKTQVEFHREIVQRMKEEAKRAGIQEVETRVMDGTPAVVLQDNLTSEPVDLMVVGARGLSTSARLFLGSVSSTLVADAPCNVLVVRSHADQKPEAGPHPILKVVTAVDGSAPSMRGLDLGVELARTLDIPLRVVTVESSKATPPPTPSTPARPFPTQYEAWVELLRKDSLKEGVKDVGAEVLPGPPVDAILTYVGANPSTLLIVGSRGLTPTKRLLLGSVSTALLHLVPSMILVVKGRAGPSRGPPRRGASRSTK